MVDPGIARGHAAQLVGRAVVPVAADARVAVKVDGCARGLLCIRLYTVHCLLHSLMFYTLLLCQYIIFELSELLWSQGIS